MSEALQVLILEDVPTDALLLEIELQRGFDVDVRRVESEDAFVRELEESPPDVILSDYRLPQYDGLQALQVARRLAPTVPFIMVTGPGNEETVAECMKAGATDYVIKDRLTRLNAAVMAGLEKKRAERRLRRDENLMRLIFGTVADLIALLDENGAIVQWSGSYARLVGGGEGAPPRGVTIFEPMPEGDRAMARTALADLLASGTGCRLEYRLFSGQGECRLVEGRWDVLQVGPGEAPRVIAVARDITDRKRSEEALRKSRSDVEALNRELIRAHETKTELLANMTHELRTPMNSIIGFSDLLLTGNRLDPDESRQFLQHIHDAGQRLIRLIDDLLELARIEAGKLVLHKRDFDLRELLESTVSGLFRVAARKSITVRVAEGWMGLCHGDPVRLRQVVMTLVSSAIKLTPPGGRVDVGTRREEGRILLTVRDNSEGLGPADQERLFRAFEQVTARGSGREGNGISLAITREVIQAHGGDLALESCKGKGNLFVVSLPQ